MYLPDGPGQANDGSSPLAEAGADLRERYWVAYAVPVEPGATGDEAFAIDQRGNIYVHNVWGATLDDIPGA